MLLVAGNLLVHLVEAVERVADDGSIELARPVLVVLDFSAANRL
jgi:hypothetical protein